MDWLAAVGVVANPISNIVDAVTGTGTEKAKAAQAAANAQTAAINAQIEAERFQAESNRQMMLYGLIGVGVVVAGAIAYKAVA